MAIYRVRAELRRDCSGTPWELGGFVFAEAWHPVADGVEPPSGSHVVSRNVDLVDLPAFLAPDDVTAIAVARDEAARAGYTALAAKGPPPGTFRIAMPELPELDGEG